ncbi:MULTISPECIES: hypothetical protein [unclassified Lacrimispora]|uniref:hypothetical protein n=1 Tax=unclassified Lacrimispora TaxID=2719232 RepID=UPI00376F6440
MEKLINIGTLNGISHYASLKVERDCFGHIHNKELYSVQGGTMEYIKSVGIKKCIRYVNFDSMKIDMEDVYKNCIFTWNDSEYINAMAE